MILGDMGRLHFRRNIGSALYGEILENMSLALIFFRLQRGSLFQEDKESKHTAVEIK